MSNKPQQTDVMDNRMIIETAAELTLEDTYKGADGESCAYVGMEVYCKENNCVYRLRSLFVTDETNWKIIEGHQQRLYLEGDADTFYPVLFQTEGAAIKIQASVIAQAAKTKHLSIFRRFSDTAPDTWNTSTHSGGLTFYATGNFDSSRGGNGGQRKCRSLYSTSFYRNLL